jgi:hypothetical protein
VLATVILFAKWLLSKTVTAFFSPSESAGEPNYETAVVPNKKPFTP